MIRSLFPAMCAACALASCDALNALGDKVEADASGPNFFVPVSVALGPDHPDGPGSDLRVEQVAVVADRQGSPARFEGLRRQPLASGLDTRFDKWVYDLTPRRDGRYLAALVSEDVLDTFEGYVIVWRGGERTPLRLDSDNIVYSDFVGCDLNRLFADEIAAAVAGLDPERAAGVEGATRRLDDVAGGDLGEYDLQLPGWTESGELVVGIGVAYYLLFEIDGQTVDGVEAVPPRYVYLTYAADDPNRLTSCRKTSPAIAPAPADYPVTAERLRGSDRTLFKVRDAALMTYLRPDRRYGLNGVAGDPTPAVVLPD